MTGLKVTRGNKLELPLSAVTEVISFLATRGAGKSFAGADIAEELYANHLQFVVVDPMGVYWGLRSSYDGNKAGLGVIVAGGERGDVPLEPTSGALIADVIVDSGQSFVLDLSLFDSKADQVRFMEAFCERLFYRKGPIDQRTPLMVIVDEADEFAPQKPEKNETKMLSHMIRLAKRGRTRGIGLCSLTQRSAEFHKGILDLSSTVIFMRTAGPRDRAAIKKWLAGSAPDLIDLVDERFPRLDTGQGLVYSPHWLKLEEPLDVLFRMIRTFDSYKTPEPGEARPAPAKTAAIDLEALGEQIAATVERAKENDPTELRRRIRELERQREQAVAAIEKPLQARIGELEHALKQQSDEPKLVVTDEQIEQLRGAAEEIKAVLGPAFEPLRETINAGSIIAEQILRALDEAREPRPPAETVEQREEARQPTPLRDVAAARPPVRPPSPQTAATNGHSDISTPQQKILDALAWFEAVGVRAPRKVPLAAVAGVSAKSSGYRNNLGSLSTAGLICYPGSGHVQLTDAGRAQAKPPAYIGTPEELQEAVYRMVSNPQAALLRELVAAYPEPLDRETLADRAGVSVRSSGFRNNLGRLSSFEMLTYPRPGYVRAAPLLFLEDAIAA